jgi:hypothetical protein
VEGGIARKQMKILQRPIARGASAALLVTITAVSISCSLTQLGHHTGDGGFATRAMIDGPAGLAVIDHAVYVAEMERAQIRRIDLATGIISTVNTSQPLDATFSLCADHRGRLLVVEHSRISRIDPRNGVVSTIAGIGTPGATGDGGPATEAKLWIPSACTTDAQGNLYIADSAAKRIRRVDAQSGTISTFTGTGRNERAATVAWLVRPASSSRTVSPSTMPATFTWLSLATILRVIESAESMRQAVW